MRWGVWGIGGRWEPADFYCFEGGVGLHVDD
jgi:hypothetical protein